MGHPQQRMRAGGRHLRQAGGVAEGTGSEVKEQQRSWVEVAAAKVSSGESQSGQSVWQCSVDRGAAQKHEGENAKGNPSALSSQRL
jgi:hypothetical protein